MGRKPRQLSETGLYHVIIRGNNKGRLFRDEADFDKFLKIASEYREKHPGSVHHYCLMANHVHLLIKSEDPIILSKYMHSVQRAYHHYYRKRYVHFGHLFQGRYRSFPVETEGYLLDCGRYIERNPVRAGMVEDPKDWRYSSYGFYAYGQEDDLVTESVMYKALGEGAARQKLYREYVEVTRPYEKLIDKELVGV